LQEIKEAIVLAAGSSRRMGELSNDKPKCLLPYKDETILGRIIRQLKENGVENVIVSVGYMKERIIEHLKNIKGINIITVVNERYKEDVNIYSMMLTLKKIKGGFVIFEADTIMEDHLVQYVTGADFEGKSVWFTNGPFTERQYGGILRSDEKGNIIDIKIVKDYEKKYSDYRKLTGIMRIAQHQLDPFRRLVNEYVNKTIQQYYLIPWIEHLKKLPCMEGNAEHYIFKTFNKQEEYMDIINMEFDQKILMKEDVELAKVSELRHIEEFNEERVKILVEKIEKEGVWTKPLYIEKKHNLVLDGQHRLQVALRLGIKYVPVQCFQYEDVKVWSLRKDEEVNIPTVIKKASEGKPYPYKTVKHKFSNVISKCNIPLSSLINKNKEDILV
jgi:choline kinase